MMEVMKIGRVFDRQLAQRQALGGKNVHGNGRRRVMLNHSSRNTA